MGIQFRLIGNPATPDNNLPIALDARYGRIPTPGEAMQYVTADGSNLNDGLTWGSAKATVAAAIAALPIGGLIQVGPGVYNLTATMTPGAGIKIRGVGSEVSKALHDTEAASEETAFALVEPAQTSFKWTGTAGAKMFQPPDGAHGVSIENVRFDGNNLADVGMCWSGAFDCWYDQITLENFTHGIGHAIQLLGIPGTAQGNVTRVDGGRVKIHHVNVPLFIRGDQAAGNFITLNTIKRLWAWDVKTLGIDFVANCDSNTIDDVFIELDNTSPSIIGGIRFNGSATPDTNVDADGNYIKWVNIDQHDATTLGPYALIFNAAHLNKVVLGFSIFPGTRLMQENYPAQGGNDVTFNNDRRQGQRTALVPFEIGALGHDWVNGEPTHQGDIRLNGRSGDLAADGGIEIKVSPSGAGYGWRWGYPDLGGGLTPAILMARNGSATWTEVSRWLMDGGNLVGGMRLNNAAAMYSGSGAPDVGLGVDGDFYFRNDTPGTVNQRVYVKAAGAWSGIL